MENHSEKALRDFLSEAEEILEEMGQDVLSVENAVHSGSPLDPDIVNRLFRGAHSLKGVSGMFGFGQLSKIAHSLEDLLDQIRLGKIAFADDVLDFLLSGIGTLRAAVADVSKSGGDVDESTAAPFSDKVAKFVAAKASSTQDDIFAAYNIAPDIVAVLTEYEEHRLRENLRARRNIFRISVKYPLMEFDQRLGAATESLKKLGELITTLPSKLEADADQIAFDLLVGTDSIEAQVKQQLAGDDPLIATIAAAKPAASSEDAGGPDTDSESLRSLSKTVRVDIDKIDQISNIVGELVLIKSTLGRLTDEMKLHTGASGTAIEIAKQAKLLDRKLSELQKSVMDVRMVPMRQVFDKLNRIVRKTSKELDKEIDLEILGADTELDKLLIEDLADPLMHLVRNAIDHGIEAPSARLKSGKPARGKLSVRAYQKGNHVAIEIIDDGNGIDADAVRVKALERGLIRQDQELASDEVYQLLFEPGFSTKSEVTEISGRGVGLDVVKNNIASMGGLIDITSELGQGTKFSLTLPITLAIIQALLVDVCDDTYAIPLNSVLESMFVDPDHIETIESREVMQYRDSTLPLIRLEASFGLKRKGMPPSQPFVVVVGLAEKRMGLLVDRMRGQQDVVIKPIRSILSSIAGIAGAADMGDSRTVLILDVASIIEEQTRHLHA